MKRPLEWQIATVKAIKQETPTVKTFTLTLPDWMQHKAGQHYDIRLTAPDGYEAQRSYSIASPPEQTGEVDLTVERLEDGEVSSYMHEVLIPGDLLELRGPIGGYFVWETTFGGPLMLIAGGSGMFEDVIYRDELDQLTAANGTLEVFHTLTRSHPAGWTGYGRRIDQAMLTEVAAPLNSPQVYVCGPTPLVEAVANSLVQIGIGSTQIRTERFGPTGTSAQ